MFCSAMPAWMKRDPNRRIRSSRSPYESPRSPSSSQRSGSRLLWPSRCSARDSASLSIGQGSSGDEIVRLAQACTVTKVRVLLKIRNARSLYRISDRNPRGRAIGLSCGHPSLQLQFRVSVHRLDAPAESPPLLYCATQRSPHLRAERRPTTLLVAVAIDDGTKVAESIA